MRIGFVSQQTATVACKSLDQFCESRMAFLGIGGGVWPQSRISGSLGGYGSSNINSDRDDGALLRAIGYALLVAS